MVELAVRLILSGLLTLVSGVWDHPTFDFAWKAAAAWSALASFEYLLEAYGYKNPGIAGFFAVGEAFLVALVVASVHGLNQFGFLAVLPLVWAAQRRGALPYGMAPLGAGSLLIAHNLFDGANMPSASLLLQMGGVLAIGVLMPGPKAAPAFEEAEAPIEPTFAEPREEQAYAVVEPDAFLQLRENYRQLQDRYRTLEKSERDAKLKVLLAEFRTLPEDGFHARLARKLAEHLGVQDVRVYGGAQDGELLVLKGATDSPTGAEQVVQINPHASLASIRDQATRALCATRGANDPQKLYNLVLVNRGKVQGLVHLRDANEDRLDAAIASANGIGQALSDVLHDRIEQTSHHRRLRETELMYEIATATRGAGGEEEFAGRLCAELLALVNVDEVCLYGIEGRDAKLLGQAGSPTRLLDAIDFDGISGFEGWMGSGGGQVIIEAATEDVRTRGAEAQWRRVGSFALIPLEGSEGPIAFVTLASQEAGKVDKGVVLAANSVAAEAAPALLRLRGWEEHAAGLMTAKEFAQSLNGQRGVIAKLDLSRPEAAAARYGRPAVHHAVRKLAILARPRLPLGGRLCRLPEGGLAVFLPDATTEYGGRWTDEVATALSAAPIPTPDGSMTMNLAIRGKIAEFGQQEDLFFVETGSTNAVP